MITRRDVLRIAALGTGTGLAGCVSRIDPGDGPGDDANGEYGYEVAQLGPGEGSPDWGGPDGASGTVELYRSRDRARDRLESIGALGDGGGNDGEAAGEFLDATDFGRSVLVYVASVGPDTCHDEIEVRELGVIDGTITGTVAALDTSQPDQMCGEALTYPSALIRVTPDGPRPDRASLSVVDGWGEEEVIEAGKGD